MGGGGPRALALARARRVPVRDGHAPARRPFSAAAPPRRSAARRERLAHARGPESRNGAARRFVRPIWLWCVFCEVFFRAVVVTGPLIVERLLLWFEDDNADSGSGAHDGRCAPVRPRIGSAGYLYACLLFVSAMVEVVFFTRFVHLISRGGYNLRVGAAVARRCPAITRRELAAGLAQLVYSKALRVRMVGDVSRGQVRRVLCSVRCHAVRRGAAESVCVCGAGGQSHVHRYGAHRHGLPELCRLLHEPHSAGREHLSPVRAADTRAAPPELPAPRARARYETVGSSGLIGLSTMLVAMPFMGVVIAFGSIFQKKQLEFTDQVGSLRARARSPNPDGGGAVRACVWGLVSAARAHDERGVAGHPCHQVLLVAGALHQAHRRHSRVGGQLAAVGPAGRGAETRGGAAAVGPQELGLMFKGKVVNGFIWVRPRWLRPLVGGG